MKSEQTIPNPHMRLVPHDELEQVKQNLGAVAAQPAQSAKKGTGGAFQVMLVGETLDDNDLGGLPPVNLAEKRPDEQQVPGQSSRKRQARAPAAGQPGKTPRKTQQKKQSQKKQQSPVVAESMAPYEQQQRAERMAANDATLCQLGLQVKIGVTVHVPHSVFPDYPAPDNGYWVGKTVNTKKGGTGDVGIRIAVGLNSTGSFVIRDEVNDVDVLTVASGQPLALPITSITGLQDALDAQQAQFMTAGGLSVSATVLDTFGLTAGGDGASYDRSLVTAGAIENFLENFQEGFISVLAGQDSGHRVGTITATPSSTNVPSCLAVANHVTSKLNSYTGSISTVPFATASLLIGAVNLSQTAGGLIDLRIQRLGGGYADVYAGDYYINDVSVTTLLDGKQPTGDYALNSLVNTKIDQAFADDSDLFIHHVHNFSRSSTTASAKVCFFPNNALNCMLLTCAKGMLLSSPTALDSWRAQQGKNQIGYFMETGN